MKMDVTAEVLKRLLDAKRGGGDKMMAAEDGAAADSDMMDESSDQAPELSEMEAEDEDQPEADPADLDPVSHKLQMAVDQGPGTPAVGGDAMPGADKADELAMLEQILSKGDSSSRPGGAGVGMAERGMAKMHARRSELKGKK